jgi:hypothetical protein
MHGKIVFNMKLIKRNVSKDRDNVYVVTRDGRRIESKNYSSKADAEYRAEILVNMLKQWDQTTMHKVALIYTSSPEKVY